MNKQEKVKKFDLLDCIEMKEQCPHCHNHISVGLTSFKNVSFCVGLVWTCPYCFSDFYIKKIVLESRENNKEFNQ